MADGVCDIDKQRPATHTVRVSRNGTETTLELCSAHYNQLRSQQAQTSPFEALFSDRGFSDFFSDDFPSFASQLGTPLPREQDQRSRQKQQFPCLLHPPVHHLEGEDHMYRLSV